MATFIEKYISINPNLRKAEKPLYSSVTTNKYGMMIMDQFVRFGSAALFYAALLVAVDVPRDWHKHMQEVCPPIETLAKPEQIIDDTVKVLSPERNVDSFTPTQALVGRQRLCEVYGHDYYWKKVGSSAGAPATLGLIGMTIGLFTRHGDRVARRNQQEFDAARAAKKESTADQATESA